METVKAFYDNFDKRLLKDFVSGNARVIAALEFIRDYFADTPPKNVLDIGCGIGWSSYEFSKWYPEAHIKGLDLSSNLIAVANSMFTAPNLSFSEKDLTESSHMANGQFDTVVMVDVFEHIPSNSRHHFYQELNAVLSDQFSILLTCPTKQHQHYLRHHKPDGLQPVDEDITVPVLQKFAEAVNAEIVFFANRAIWNTNDYLHAVISNRVPYAPPSKPTKIATLMSQKEKLSLLKEKGISIEGLEKYIEPSLFQRVMKKF